MYDDDEPNKTPISFGEWERLKGLLGPDNENAMATQKPLQATSNVLPNQVSDTDLYGYLPSPTHTPDEPLIGGASDAEILEIEVPNVDPDGDWIEPSKSSLRTANIVPPYTVPPAEEKEHTTQEHHSLLKGQTLWWFPGPWSEVIMCLYLVPLQHNADINIMGDEKTTIPYCQDIRCSIPNSKTLGLNFQI